MQTELLSGDEKKKKKKRKTHSGVGKEVRVNRRNMGRAGNEYDQNIMI